MVKKKIDNRIRVLIENGIQLFHRSLIVIVGDKGRDQVILEFNIIFFLNPPISFRLLFYTTCFLKLKLKHVQLSYGVTKKNLIFPR